MIRQRLFSASTRKALEKRPRPLQLRASVALGAAFLAGGTFVAMLTPGLSPGTEERAGLGGTATTLEFPAIKKDSSFDEKALYDKQLQEKGKEIEEARAARRREEVASSFKLVPPEVLQRAGQALSIADPATIFSGIAGAITGFAGGRSWGKSGDKAKVSAPAVQAEEAGPAAERLMEENRRLRTELAEERDRLAELQGSIQVGIPILMRWSLQQQSPVHAYLMCRSLCGRLRMRKLPRMTRRRIGRESRELS